KALSRRVARVGGFARIDGRRRTRTHILVLHHVRAVHLAHVARRTAAGRLVLVHFRHVAAAIHLAHVLATALTGSALARSALARPALPGVSAFSGGVGLGASHVAAGAILVHLLHVGAAAGVVLAGQVAATSTSGAPGVGRGDRATTTAAAFLRIVASAREQDDQQHSAADQQQAAAAQQTDQQRLAFLLLLLFLFLARLFVEIGVVVRVCRACLLDGHLVVVVGQTGFGLGRGHGAVAGAVTVAGAVEAADRSARLLRDRDFL